MNEAVLVDVVRTASGKGKPGGALSALHPVDLLATVLNALVDRTGIDPELIDDVITGCVGQAREQALNIGRNAVLAAGWPESVPATSVDRQCGSSQQAVNFAAQGVMAGAYDIVVAAGVESMSRVPLGTAQADGDAYGPFFAARYPEGLVNQGVAAELVAHRWKLDRETLDDYSAQSHARADECAQKGGFEDEIVPVPVRGPDGNVTMHLTDETVRASTSVAGLGNLRPAFRTDELAERFPHLDWQITPGNSSPLTDGAAAALIMNAETARTLGLRPRARFRSFAIAGDDPFLMLTAPIPASRKALSRARLNLADIDAYEVNEAFAPVPLAWATELGADLNRLNPRGGAIALGHPLGASGVRLLATLVNHLEQTGGRLGLQTMCEAGGMANATVIERTPDSAL